MDPSRKRKIRLFVALGAAVILASALVYTSFSASTEARQPSQLLSQGDSSGTYQLTGKVVPGSIRHDGGQLDFRISDRDGSRAIPVTYSGTVPDPFAAGREVIVTGKLENGTFVGERDSLITKCPSKFSASDSGRAS